MIDVYLRDTATLHQSTGQYDAHGQVITTSHSIKCRFEEKFQLIRTAGGEQVTSQARVYCSEEISVQDKLEYNGTKYQILNVLPVKDLNGKTHFWEAFL